MQKVLLLMAVGVFFLTGISGFVLRVHADEEMVIVIDEIKKGDMLQIQELSKKDQTKDPQVHR